MQSVVPSRSPDFEGQGSPAHNGDMAPDSNLIIIPVRNVALFPGIVFPITIGRAQSIEGAQQAAREGRQIGLLLQREPEMDEPKAADLYQVGIVANLLRYM